MKVRIPLFLVLAITLNACETVTEIELPVEKPQLVVNSIFNADSILTVNVTKTQSIAKNDLEFENIENAAIELYKNKVSIGQLIYAGNGNYVSQGKLPNEPYAEYSLKVKAAGFETAEANDILPQKPVLGTSGARLDSEKGNKFQPVYNISVQLIDNAETNFYELTVFDRTSNRLLFIDFKNNLNAFERAVSSGSTVYFFDDRTLNGKSINLDFDIYFDNNDGKPHDIVFKLSNISKGYFDYQYSVLRQFNSDPILNNEHFAVANNIKNGLGIFALYNASTINWQLE